MDRLMIAADSVLRTLAQNLLAHSSLHLPTVTGTPGWLDGHPRRSGDLVGGSTTARPGTAVRGARPWRVMVLPPGLGLVKGPGSVS